jgi:CheY-like chemotaxis protein
MELWADSADVLVVEDDAELRCSLLESLQQRGFFAVGAANGEEAMRIALCHCPRLIVLDLQMPVMNGGEFLERRRASELLSSVPVVIATAERSGIPSANVQAVLEKPVDEEALSSAIGALLAANGARAAHR